MSVVYRAFLIFLLFPFAVIAQQPVSGSNSYQLNLDSLSDEDAALLEMYRDSFLSELADMKMVLRQIRKKPIDTTVALMNAKSHVEISTDVQGPVYANGRNVGLSGAAFFPSILYFHKSGFYASGSLGFYSDSFMRKAAIVPLANLSAGYYKNFFRYWTLSVGYNRSFLMYADSFYSGLLNNSINASNSYNFWGYVTLTANIAASWSSNLLRKKTLKLSPMDYRSFQQVTKDYHQAYAVYLNLSLSRNFTFFNVLGAKVFSITPSFSTQIGHDNNAFILRNITTQQYQQPPKPGQPPPPPPTLQYNNFFGLLNLQPSLSLDWRIRNLEIYAGCYLAIPFNDYNSTTQIRTVNPKKYYPFGQGGVKYLFRVQKIKKPKTAS